MSSKFGTLGESLLILTFLIPGVPAAATISARRQLTNNVTWQSCNDFRICYTLKAQLVDVGYLSNRYYAAPIEIEVFKKMTNGKLIRLRQFHAKEGQWNCERNQWLLILIDGSKKEREYSFVPEQLQN